LTIVRSVKSAIAAGNAMDREMGARDVIWRRQWIWEEKEDMRQQSSSGLGSGVGAWSRREKARRWGQADDWLALHLFLP
jgi:hypothetical protein